MDKNTNDGWSSHSEQEIRLRFQIIRDRIYGVTPDLDWEGIKKVSRVHQP